MLTPLIRPLMFSYDRTFTFHLRHTSIATMLATRSSIDTIARKPQACLTTEHSLTKTFLIDCRFGGRPFFQWSKKATPRINRRGLSRLPRVDLRSRSPTFLPPH